MIKIEKLKLKTQKQFELIDITDKVKTVLESAGIDSGMLTVFSPHTTAAIRINHNEPLLIQDIIKMIYRLVPVDINYSHDLFEIRSGIDAGERSNGHAHVKAFLLGSSETIPVAHKEMQLGGKQSIFFVELDGARDREVVIQVMGE
ncbi:MAG: secondary thiamine-phosphate synthase enzyme YjbQ [Candidatus Doudnabacteria bacterium]